MSNITDTNKAQVSFEVKNERKNIKTDSMSMSIGELINMYKDGDLELDPAYQRLFRWEDDQKSKFIESVLLAIPIPEIFVAQNSDGLWSVIDGVQRLSTILQLVGILPAYSPLTLSKTKYIPSIKDFTWEELPDDIKRVFKRSKLTINIILTEAGINAQYEMFQRLNTGGLHLESQEVRNCLLIMVDQVFYDKVNELKEYENFKNCLPLSEEKFKQEYHMELILRYFIARNRITNYDDYDINSDLLSDFIDREILKLMEYETFNIDNEILLFKKTFDWIYTTMGEDAFKKYVSNDDKFKGPFLASSFEAIVSGVADNIEGMSSITPHDFRDKVKEMYSDDEYLELSKRGKRAIPRFKGMASFSKEYFA